MRIINYSYPLEKPNTENLAVALGYFDGVHLGHRKLISALIDSARDNNLTPAVLTFNHLPQKTKNTKTIIYNIDDKLSFFNNLGVEVVIMVSFESVSELSPQEFVDNVLVRDLSAKICIAGYNFKFGNKASGNVKDLENLMAKNECKAITVDEETVNGKEISSTKIRTLLADKRIEEANLLLGVPYSIGGTVEKGIGKGKQFGFPTVNTPIRENSPLPTGVYRSAVNIDGILFTGITNIGNCPTVKARETHAETLIADFNGDLYGKEIRIYLLEYLREEKKFNSVEELREQIYLDRDLSKKKNGDLKWLATGLNLQ